MSTVEKFAQTLSRWIDAPIIDKTGLTGAYEYEFRRYDPVGGVIPGRMGGPSSDAESAELLSLRPEDQLGLRLVPEKGRSRRNLCDRECGVTDSELAFPRKLAKTAEFLRPSALN